MLFVPVIAPDPQLAADGVVLRVRDDGDASWITEACNDPDIARFIVETPPPRRWSPATDVEFVIAAAAHPEPLGVISLRIAERDPGLAAVGYWLRPEARGRGAATIAVKLIARWAFGEVGVQRLELTTAPRTSRRSVSLNAQASPARASSAGWWRQRPTGAGTPCCSRSCRPISARDRPIIQQWNPRQDCRADELNAVSLLTPAASLRQCPRD